MEYIEKILQKRIMSKLKLKRRELRALGYTNGKTIGIAVNVMTAQSHLVDILGIFQPKIVRMDKG